MSDNIEAAKKNLQGIVLDLSGGKSWSGLAEVSSKSGVTELKVTQPSIEDHGKKEQFRNDGIIKTYELINTLMEKGLISGVSNNGSDLRNALENLAPEKPISVAQGATISINERGNVELSIKTSEPLENIVKKLDTTKSAGFSVAAVKQVGTESKGVVSNPFLTIT